ncbi:PREDICTED: protein PFC0760c-like isoform X2 [Polistes dominula]|uniref:Protein PFC0760c-like isoform X2 n=1 Tax=Polistes dominula TaxID=743375 RepID=A0ABM1JGT9_POLDO|nr:PREDICTED: protein PFC0760c-like isoform X2 [Polistes dominula]
MISKWVFVLFLVMNIVVSGLSRRNPHHHIRRHTSNINSNSKDHSNEQITNRLYTNNDDESIGIGEKAREIMKTEEAKVSVPFNERKLEKMLEKAIIKIIMGDLTNADMNLLKSLNYSLTEILTIRNNELAKQEEKKRLEIIQMEKIKSKSKHYEKKKREKFEKKSTDNEDFDFDAFNRQALLDYENLPTEMELQQTRSDDTGDNDYNDQMSKEKNTEDKNNSPDNFHRHFDKAMEPHVVFKIRYDDSEFDSSSSEEKSNAVKKQPTNRDFSNTKVEDSLTNTANSFPPFTSDPPLPLPLRSSSFSSLSPPSSTSLPVISKNFHIIDDRLRDLTNNVEILETHLDDSVNLNNVNLSKNSSDNVDDNVTNDSELKKEDSTTGKIDNGGSDASKSSVKRISEYEGLEWVEDDVYRVIPSLANNLGDYENVEDNESSLNYDDEILSFYAQNTTHCKKNERENDNDTAEYQNDNPETIKLVMANTNLTSVENQSFGSYQQMLQAHRKDQGQKAIEDIKSRVLALTGRFNLSSNANTVQREKLTMFPPTCRLPRNTDEEAWSDPFLMNMHFRLNLTWDEHVIAAKLRIYKLPQENLTLSSTNDSDGDIPDEEDEKRIRISVYYYTRALKKHRARKRLMDSVMTPLTSVGTHLALDIRQGLKFWRVDPRSPYANTGNYGLVIQVEDQDGKPLKPALYIQEPSCPNGDDVQKACNHLPALFIRACTRYVRVVNGETVTYMNCRH